MEGPPATEQDLVGQFGNLPVQPPRTDERLPLGLLVTAASICPHFETPGFQEHRLGFLASLVAAALAAKGEKLPDEFRQAHTTYQEYEKNSKTAS